MDTNPTKELRQLVFNDLNIRPDQIVKMLAAKGFPMKATSAAASKATFVSTLKFLADGGHYVAPGLAQRKRTRKSKGFCV